MSKFLDEGGVITLWNKIKLYCSTEINKALSGEGGGQGSTTPLSLNDIQAAINSGCGVELPMPSDNDNKLSLPIWTGTSTEYEKIKPKVNGMTYNIID